MTKQIAEILVDIKYAITDDEDGSNVLVKDEISDSWEWVDPFLDELGSIRQAQALIEHFRVEHNELWRASKLDAIMAGKTKDLTWWQHALARLKYCIDNVEG